MPVIIDTSLRLDDADLDEAKRAGAVGIIRYINNRNSQRLPTKRITADELRRIGEKGLRAALVFQQRAGQGGHLSDFNLDKADRDGRRALTYARDELKVPAGATIYFSVDDDYYRNSELTRIIAYFKRVNEILRGTYTVSGYGNGAVLTALTQRNLIEKCWISLSIKHSGSRDFRRRQLYHLNQVHEYSGAPGDRYGNLAKPCDVNETNPSFNNDYGGFEPDVTALGGTPPAFFVGDERPIDNLPDISDLCPGRYEVNARSGLRLRSGPGTEFEVRETLVVGTDVTVVGFGGEAEEWALVDLQGDGTVDGYMYAAFLSSIEDGRSFELCSHDVGEETDDDLADTVED